MVRAIGPFVAVFASAFIVLSATSSASAMYFTYGTGYSLNGETVSPELCKAYHGGNYERVIGFQGDTDTTSPFNFLWVSALCEGLWTTNPHGIVAYNHNPLPEASCPSGSYVNALASYYNAYSIVTFLFACIDPTTGSESYPGWLGQNYTGSFNSGRCNNSDVLYGVVYSQPGNSDQVDDTADTEIDLICGAPDPNTPGGP